MFCGVVGIDVIVEWLPARIFGLNSQEGGYAFLMRRDGSVIAFTDNAYPDLGYDTGVRPDHFNLFDRARPEMQPELTLMASGASGIGRVVVDGAEKIIAYHPVVTSGWVLGLVVPVELVTRALLNTEEKMKDRTSMMITQMFFFFFFLVLVVLLVTFWASRKIAHPVRELAEGARRIGGGDLSYQVSGGPDSDDEIGYLASSFNEMARSLKERQEELAVIQQELIQSESLSSMGKVAAGVAHEIRNALGVIKNSMYYLKGKVEADSGDERRTQVTKHMMIIEKEINIAETIVSDLLTFASPLVPHLKAVDLHEILEQAAERIPFPENIQVFLDLHDHPSIPRIEGDPVLLGQVFFNIMQNAMQAMPDGGNLKVTLSFDEGETLVKIADSGVGISEKNLGLLFEPFFTTRAKGIGLGLSLSRWIIEEHGRTITV